MQNQSFRELILETVQEAIDSISSNQIQNLKNT